ncbi:unnamed protein product [Mortierella alpina]
MPASRPQHPDRQAKTTTAATASATITDSSIPAKEQPQPQLQYAIVSSPLSSPTNPHLERFSAPSPSLSFAHLQSSQLKSNSSIHATDSYQKNKSSPENVVVEVLPNSSSVSSTSSSHSSSSNRNVASSRARTLPPPPPQAQQAKAQSESQTQMIALAEARVFAQQLHQQQLQQQQHQQQHLHQQSPNQFMSHLDASRRGSLTGARPHSVVGSLVSGRGSTAASAAVDGSLSPVLRGGGVGGDEPAEQTLLLVRPVWVQDQDAAACRICARAFNAVRRKHHCRQCGHIFCYDCSSRSIALPQLGYTKAVRVCNGCFEVAYLVAYCLSDDLGPSTQIHGARGLYELIETNNEKVLENVIEHGGLDAIVYLCSVVHGFELHALATKSLAALSDYQAIQGMIVAKRAMPKLFHLVAAYAYHVASPPRPPSPPMPLTRMASTASLHTTGVRRIETIAAVLIYITHIVYQMVPDKSLARQMAKEGAVDGLMCLCVYFPAGVRTRAMEHAIQSVSRARDEAIKGRANTPLSDSQRDDDDTQSQRSTPLQAAHGDDEEDDAGVVSMDDQFHVQLENMQGQAARCLSVLAADVSNQAFIVDDPERIDRLVQLLYSNNPDVVKYASKTMAYLSLRNDRYKPDIVKGAGAAALLTVIRTGSESHSSSNDNALSEAVSHACCALANLATNTESQEILMSHLDLLNATCSVVGLFPHQREIERHVARLIANLALYDQNKLSLLTAYSTPSDRASLDVSQGPRDSHPVAVPHRYSSPPPPARRAKGNVIPTLLYIGAQTLERTGVAENTQEEAVYLQQGQDAIDFMNDDHASTQADAGYLTPNDSASENDVGHGEHERSIHEEVIAEWVTVPGMEDVQRHIIRAIDNLITSVVDDPASHQSFKVFSRIWPTIGLIKTIQMTNQDEDTQRRATHVLSTLVHQQQIHAETIAALKERSPSPEPHAKVDVEAQLNGLGEEEQLEKQRLTEEQQRLADEAEAAAAKAAELEQAGLEKEKHVREQVVKKQKERNDREAAKEKLEQEKVEREAQEAEERDRLQKKAEEERLEAERQEQERVAVARAKKERIEQERLEKERLEKERLEQEQLEKDHLKQERSEKKRREKERLEKERLENERLENERLEKERLEGERLEKERLEKERLEEERLEKERLEKGRLEKERVEKERVEEERLEKERLEKECNDHLVPEQIQAQEEQGTGSDGTKAVPKGGSSSEDQTTSHDEEPKPKEKAKKKKKKLAK